MRDSRRNLLLESSPSSLPLHDSSTSSVSASEHRQRCSKNLHEEGGETMQQTAQEQREGKEKGKRKSRESKLCRHYFSSKKFPSKLLSPSAPEDGNKPFLREGERFLKAERKETWKGGFSTLLVSCYNLPESVQRSLFPSPLSSPHKDGLSTIRCNPPSSSCEISCQAWLHDFNLYPIETWLA